MGLYVFQWYLLHPYLVDPNQSLIPHSLLDLEIKQAGTINLSARCGDQLLWENSACGNIISLKALMCTSVSQHTHLYKQQNSMVSTTNFCSVEQIHLEYIFPINVFIWLGLNLIYT